MKVTEEVYRVELVEEEYKVTLTEEEIKFIEVAPVILELTSAVNVTKSLQCGEVIGSGKVVYLSNGKIYIASSDNPDCTGKVIGMTSQSGLEDSFVNVVLSGECNGLSLITNDQYYLGLNGAVTKIMPLTGVVYPIGLGIGTDRININIENYIIRG